MNASFPVQKWEAVRESVRVTAGRFCDLVASVDPGAMATAEWTVADTLAHLTTISFLNTLLLAEAAPPFDMAEVSGPLAATTVEGVHSLNDLVMSRFTERDADKLLRTFRERVSLMLTASQDRDPGQRLPWLGNAQLPVAGMFAHLVNEMLIHGDDIARSLKVPWTMPPQDAALFFDLFYVGLASGDPGVLLDGSRRPLARAIAVEFHSDYTEPVTFVVRDGRLTTRPPGPGTDITIRFDPATLNKMMFGRISKQRAVLTRRIIISGRRPWLLPAFLRTVRLPS